MVVLDLNFTDATVYCIEGHFGGCKLWRISYKNTFGDIIFDKFDWLFNVEQGRFAEETLANLW